jgi:hypothetical protein
MRGTLLRVIQYPDPVVGRGEPVQDRTRVVVRPAVGEDEFDTSIEILSQHRCHGISDVLTLIADGNEHAYVDSGARGQVQDFCSCLSVPGAISDRATSRDHAERLRHDQEVQLERPVRGVQQVKP